MANLERLFELTKLCHQHDAQLVAVSKTKSVSEIIKVYNNGQKIFGENRVQELLEKYQELPEDIHWHMIGHLQTNKVKEIIPFVRMIHAVDSLKLARMIDKQAGKAGRNVSILLQIRIAQEETKYGFDMEELVKIFDQGLLQNLPFLQISGVMGMATFTNDMVQVRTEFKTLRKCFDQIKDSYFNEESSFREISMGMSGDYNIALEEGSTIIRVGSAIFGERD